MLLLNLKQHSKIFIGEGRNEVELMLCDVIQNPDGSFVARLGFVADKHICIDRESVRKSRRAKVDKVIERATGATDGNPKD